jgi:hypothetical protein
LEKAGADLVSLTELTIELELTPNFMDRVQVTGSKTPLSVGDLPAAPTAIISRQTIDHRGDQRQFRQRRQISIQIDVRNPRRFCVGKMQEWHFGGCLTSKLRSAHRFDSRFHNGTSISVAVMVRCEASVSVRMPYAGVCRVGEERALRLSLSGRFVFFTSVRF